MWQVRSHAKKGAASGGARWGPKGRTRSSPTMVYMDDSAHLYFDLEIFILLRTQLSGTSCAPTACLLNTGEEESALNAHISNLSL